MLKTMTNHSQHLLDYARDNNPYYSFSIFSKLWESGFLNPDKKSDFLTHQEGTAARKQFDQTTGDKS